MEVWSNAQGASASLSIDSRDFVSGILLKQYSSQPYLCKVMCFSFKKKKNKNISNSNTWYASLRNNTEYLIFPFYVFDAIENIKKLAFSS